MDRLKTAERLLNMAKALIAKDYEYIYDPEHKKHPGGGFQKTDKGWQKGKQDKGNEKSTTPTTQTAPADWKQAIKNADSNKRRRMSKDRKCPKKILNLLATDKNYKVRANVAANPGTPSPTLEKMAKRENPETGPGQTVIDSLLGNKKLSATAVFDIADKFEEDCDWGTAQSIVQHPNMKPEHLEELYQSTYSLEIKVTICNSDKTPTEFLRKRIEEWWQDDPEGEYAFDNYKKRTEPTAIGYGFKKRTEANQRFELELDDEEYHSAYGELAKFKKDKPDSNHSKSYEKLKRDFINRMDPANYETIQAYKHAKERVQKLSTQDFATMLKSIFAEEDQEI